MIPEEFLSALKLIMGLLADKQIDWAVFGGTNHALQGLDIIPNDIDIITDKQGALLIDKELEEYADIPTRFVENDNFKAFIGVYHLEGVEIEVWGDLHQKNPAGDLWSEQHEFSARTWITLDGYEVPVISLEQEYQAYSKLGKTERADKLEELLQGYT